MDQLTPIQKIEAMEKLLDEMPGTTGRAQCYLIWAMSELLKGLKKEILPQEEPEIRIAVQKKNEPDGNA